MPLLRARLGRSRDDSGNQECRCSEKNKQCTAICSSRVCHRNLHRLRIDMRDYTARKVSTLAQRLSLPGKRRTRTSGSTSPVTRLTGVGQSFDRIVDLTDQELST